MFYLVSSKSCRHQGVNAVDARRSIIRYEPGIKNIAGANDDPAAYFTS
jgi:hypothetical protein